MIISKPTVNQYFATMLLLLSLLTSGSAVAVDPFVYPGSNCVRHYGPNPIYLLSAIGNPSSTSSLYVDCPSAYDHTGFLDGSWFRAQDNIAGNSLNQRVQCSTINAWMNGVGEWVTRTRFAQTSGTGTQTRAVSSFRTVHAVESHSFLSCRLPPTQFGQTNWLTSYSVNP